MFKDLKEFEVDLERRAQETAENLRRVVKEYSDSARGGNGSDPAGLLRKQREIDQVAGEFIRLNKALKRVRKQMQVEK